MTSLLTLDLSSNVGWTLGNVEDRGFAFGSHQLPKTGEDIGAFAEAYDPWLSRMIQGVDHVVFEAPILPPQTSLQTLRKLHGLCWHTEYVAKICDIKCGEANVMQIRAYLGRGFMKKDEVLAAVKRYGFDAGTDHDAADAIAVRLFTLEREYPHVARKMNLDLGQLGATANA